jgi:hypothetical protein
VARAPRLGVRAPPRVGGVEAAGGDGAARAVRSRLLRGLHAERQQRRVQELLRRLRREYVVRVERPGGAPS